MALLDGPISPRMMEAGRYKARAVLALITKGSSEPPDEFEGFTPHIRSCRLTATLILRLSRTTLFAA